MKYSVLMSVYYKEKAENLRVSMDSMWKQTVQPDEFVLVCDGPLTKELDAVILDMQSTYVEKLKVIRIEKNMGLGNALNIGLKHCKNEIVARMDSDDIAKPERCEKEISIFSERPGVAVIGSAVTEFTDSLINLGQKRVVPHTNKEILEFIKFRNPFNHPTVMFRKQSVLDVGGYPNVRYLQDYYLWTMMFAHGYEGFNFQESLVYMRAGEDMYKRRSGSLYIKIQIELFNYMRKVGFINWFEWFVSVSVRCVSSLAPNCLRALLYRYVLRE